MPLLSVVTPVYNMSGFIYNCVNSILNQTFKDFELLLIDDGSTDGSSKICDDFALLDNRVKVVHKTNGGLASALNAGIDHSIGKYIVFVDSDDFIRLEALEWLVDAAVDHCAEMAVFELQRGSDNHCVWENPTSTVYECSGLELIKNSLIGKSGKSWMLHGKIFSRSCFNNTRFPDGRIYEDNSTVYKILYQLDKVVCSDDTVYYYYTNPEGIVNSTFSLKHLDYLLVLEEMIEFFTNHHESELLDWAHKSYLYSLADMYRKVHENCSEPSVEAELKRKLLAQYKQEKEKYPINMETYPSVIEVLKPTYAKLYWQSKALKQKLTGK